MSGSQLLHGYARCLLLVAAGILTRLGLPAQSVLVPDTYLRGLINTFVPGAVDANGYIDMANPAVVATESLELTVNWTPVDLTGIEAFSQLRFLSVTKSMVMQPLELNVTSWPATLEHLYLFGNTGALPPWPTGLSYLGLLGDQTSAGQVYPALPAGLDSLFFHPLPDIPTVPVLPAGLTYLSMKASDLANVVPVLPSGLVDLALWGYAFPASPNWPAGLEKLSLSTCSFPASLQGLPSGITELSLTGCSIPLGLYDLPSGLVTASLVSMMDSPLQITFWPAGLQSLVLQGEGSAITLPDWPLGLLELELTQVPALSVLDSFPTGLTSLLLRSLNNIPALPPFPVQLTQLHLIDLPVATLPDLPPLVESMTLTELPLLACIPYLPQSLQVLRLGLPGGYPLPNCLPNLPQNLVIIDYGGGPTFPDPGSLCTSLTSTCPFVNPVASGTVYWDANVNGVRDIGETGYPFAAVNVQPGNYTFGTAADGSFLTPLPVGSYMLSALGASPYVTGIAPASLSVNLPMANTIAAGNDFGVVLQPGVQDLRVDAVVNVARPGFDNLVTIIYRNMGTMTMSGSVDLTFDADQTWVNASVSPTTLGGNQASWSFSGLLVGEMRTINVQLHTDATVALGTPLTHSLEVGPVAADATPSDNAYQSSGEVVGSFDPNDKLVLPATATVASVSAGLELAFTIRFQNTGTYHAERVLITDTLSTDLQWGSMRFIASSHPCTWTLLDNGVLRFTFEPIMLPDSASDEPGSHGFVRFAMKPLSTLALGAQVSNVANIHFDYNAPVITEPAVFTVDNTAQVLELPGDEGLRVWPVPVTDLLHFACPGVTVLGAELMDLHGRRLVAVGPAGRLDASALSAGCYVLRVTTAEGAFQRPVLKR